MATMAVAQCSGLSSSDLLVCWRVKLNTGLQQVVACPNSSQQSGSRRRSKEWRALFVLLVSFLGVGVDPFLVLLGQRRAAARLDPHLELLHAVPKNGEQEWSEKWSPQDSQQPKNVVLLPTTVVLVLSAMSTRPTIN